MSQITTVPSSLAEASVFPSGLNPTPSDPPLVETQDRLAPERRAASSAEIMLTSPAPSLASGASRLKSNEASI